jgi:hypothetical protein
MDEAATATAPSPPRQRLLRRNLVLLASYLAVLGLIATAWA